MAAKLVKTTGPTPKGFVLLDALSHDRLNKNSDRQRIQMGSIERALRHLLEAGSASAEELEGVHLMAADVLHDASQQHAAILEMRVIPATNLAATLALAMPARHPLDQE